MSSSSDRRCAGFLADVHLELGGGEEQESNRGSVHRAQETQDGTVWPNHDLRLGRAAVDQEMQVRMARPASRNAHATLIVSSEGRNLFTEVVEEAVHQLG
jgi:hypothetical protein